MPKFYQGKLSYFIYLIYSQKYYFTGSHIRITPEASPARLVESYKNCLGPPAVTNIFACSEFHVAFPSMFLYFLNFMWPFEACI